MIDKNSTTSQWVDIEELAQAQDLDILNDDGEPVTEEFLQNMDIYRRRDPVAGSGIVWRWIVGCPQNSNQLNLMVQALPCTLERVEATEALRAENTKGIIVWTAAMDYYTFTNVPIPVPTIFSIEPEVTLKMLRNSPEFAYSCLQALASKLLVAGELTRYSVHPHSS